MRAAPPLDPNPVHVPAETLPEALSELRRRAQLLKQYRHSLQSAHPAVLPAGAAVPPEGGQERL